MAPGLISPDSPPHHASETPSISSSTKPVVYMIDELHPDAVRHAQERFTVVLPTDPEVKNWRENAEYLLVRGSYVTADDVKAARKLKAMGKQGVGIDKIDGEACEKAGVKIFNTPGVNSQAVAELVLALTLSVAREIGSISVKQSNGLKVPKQTCNGLLLRNKTLGLIGMGNIGKTAAKMFQGGFNCKIVAYDPFLPADAWSDVPHVRASTVAEVLEAADVLSVHVPLTPQTRDLINYDGMKTMKRNAIVINTARGGIINEEDLARALSEGLIWGAGLDCHEQEPPTKEKYEKLWAHPRVVSTPHVGAATEETQRDTAVAAVDRLYGFVCPQ